MNPSLETNPSAASAPLTDPVPCVNPDPNRSGPQAVPKRRVLIVDDEERILNSLQRLLRREPYELVTARSAQEALSVLEQGPVQLVISDHRMPGTTGVELLREIQSRWPDTVRVILSGYSEVNTVIAAINEGAIYKFLCKPWNDAEVKLHIRRALEQYELLTENKRLAREIADQNRRLLDLNKQLEQRAADATAGLNSVQDLLDLVDAAVIIVDPCGLVVGANRRASEVISPEAGGLIGVSAANALPPELYETLLACKKEREEPCSGSLEHRGQPLQWRAQLIREGGTIRGTVVTVWEVIE